MPEDLELSGKSETFTVTVTYDTLELYGRIEASRQFAIVLD